MAFKFIVLFGFLAAASAGDLTPGYVSYAPAVHKTIQYAEPLKTIQYAAPVEYAAKTIEYAAPVQKTLFQPSPVYAKTLIAPEPYNYHTAAYAPSAYAAHGTVSHHGKTIATPHSYVSKYDTRYVHEDPHYYPSAIVKTPIVPAVTKVVAPVIPTVVKAPVVPVVKSYDHGYGHSYDHSYDHSYGQPYGHSYGHPAPVIAKTAAVSYSPAVAVSHATFESAHGHYAW